MMSFWKVWKQREQKLVESVHTLEERAIRLEHENRAMELKMQNIEETHRLYLKRQEHEANLKLTELRSQLEFEKKQAIAQAEADRKALLAKNDLRMEESTVLNKLSAQQDVGAPNATPPSRRYGKKK